MRWGIKRDAIMSFMRTTLTLDDDVAAELKKAAYERGEPFKRVVNEALRAGLAAARATGKPRTYRLEPQSLGSLRSGVNLDKALRLADELEDAAIVDELQERK